MTARLTRKETIRQWQGREIVNHSYTFDGRRTPGVTTILDGSLPKPALVPWAANTTAEYAVNNWADLTKLEVSERLQTLKDARKNTMRAAALRGTQIHALGERISHGEPVDVPDEHVGPVNAYARFLDGWDVSVVATEAPVANATIGYAGTLDAVATSPKINDGAPFLLDIKTGKGVYDETALQLAAYAKAEIWQPDGPDSEQDMIIVSALYVAHVLPDAVRFVPIVANIDTLFLQFRYAFATYRWIQANKDTSPIGFAIEPALL